jgi:hypothetical protein
MFKASTGRGGTEHHVHDIAANGEILEGMSNISSTPMHSRIAMTSGFRQCQPCFFLDPAPDLERADAQHDAEQRRGGDSLNHDGPPFSEWRAMVSCTAQAVTPVHQRRGDEADGQQRQQVGPQHIRIAQDTHAAGTKKQAMLVMRKLVFL